MMPSGSLVSSESGHYKLGYLGMMWLTFLSKKKEAYRLTSKCWRPICLSGAQK